MRVLRRANCPNCSAPITAPYCPYCGTPTYSESESVVGAWGKDLHCWYEDDGVKICFDIRVNSINSEHLYDTYHADGGRYLTVPRETAVSIEATMLDFDQGAWERHLDDWRTR